MPYLSFLFFSLSISPFVLSHFSRLPYMCVCVCIKMCTNSRLCVCSNSDLDHDHKMHENTNELLKCCCTQRWEKKTERKISRSSQKKLAPVGRFLNGGHLPPLCWENCGHACVCVCGNGMCNFSLKLGIEALKSFWLIAIGNYVFPIASLQNLWQPNNFAMIQ